MHPLEIHIKLSDGTTYILSTSKMLTYETMRKMSTEQLKRLVTRIEGNIKQGLETMIHVVEGV